MSDLSHQLVREYFELCQFQVLTVWRPDEEGRDASPLLLVEQGDASPGGEPPFLLQGDDVGMLSRAVVDVRAWHADRFYPSVIENNPVLTTAASPRTLDAAARVFGSQPFSAVLIISELPQNPEPRRRSLELFARHGLDHVMEFGSVLQGLLLRINSGASYAPSATLQTIRLLKRYGFISNQQMELEFPRSRATE